MNRKIQSAQIDERTYHEVLVHPSLITLSAPKDVLIVGGGGTLREALRHDPVRKVTMVDIDQELDKLCQEYLPEWSDGAFANSKTHLVFGEARRFVEESQESYDVIISDLTDPADDSPSVYLFTEQFFRKVHEVLTIDLYAPRLAAGNRSSGDPICCLSKLVPAKAGAGRGFMPRPRRGGREPDVNRVTKAELLPKVSKSVPPPS